MWEAVKTRMSGRAVWEWAAVVVFVGVLASFVVYATNPDGTLEITPDDNDSKHVWGINETISYTATCSHTCDTECNTGFDETAGLTQTDGYDSDGIAYVTGTKSDTGSYTLEAECPEDGSHGEPTQIFKVVDIDCVSVDGEQLINGDTVFVPIAPSGSVTVSTTLAPTATVSELRSEFMTWIKKSGSLNFTQSDQLTVTVPKDQTGGIIIGAKAGSEGTDWSFDIVVFDVNITTPSTFPAYVGVDEELPLESTVTPMTGRGGTYQWYKVSGPGNVTFSPSSSSEDPSFSADAAGDYMVEVEYTIDHKTVYDTSGTIVCQ